MALVGLWVLPPHEDNERAGLAARVDARLENLGRDVAPTASKGPVFCPVMSETELYNEGNGLLLDGGRICVLVGRSGLTERTERRRTVLAAGAIVGTFVGSGRAG